MTVGRTNASQRLPCWIAAAPSAHAPPAAWARAPRRHAGPQQILTLLVPVTDLGRLLARVVRVRLERLGVLLVVLAPVENLEFAQSTTSGFGLYERGGNWSGCATTAGAGRRGRVSARSWRRVPPAQGSTVARTFLSTLAETLGSGIALSDSGRSAGKRGRQYRWHPSLPGPRAPSSMFLICNHARERQLLEPATLRERRHVRGPTGSRPPSRRGTSRCPSWDRARHDGAGRARGARATTGQRTNASVVGRSKDARRKGDGGRHSVLKAGRAREGRRRDGARAD